MQNGTGEHPSQSEGAGEEEHRAAPTQRTEDVLVTVSGVGKMYRLYDRPQDRLKHALFARFGRRYGREFWALHDVSFEVRRGEMVGIIGRNGSGKSTLLQILAGVLQPTVGEVQIRGKVQALLELGSGFNPEFTGRENIFLNGAILGIPRKEMEERLAEVIAFADIGEFIDQPVKTYSRGMFVRLAFAVSTALEPDILLIDEALAVGDVFFRQKCYRRLDDLLARGTAIVLVSHAMTEVEQLCKRALLLHRSHVMFQGAGVEAVKRYYLVEQEDQRRAINMSPLSLPNPEPELMSTDGYFWPPPTSFLDTGAFAQVADGWARCTGVALCNNQGHPCHTFQQGETASFFYEFELLRDIEVPIGGVVIHNDKGLVVHGKSTLEHSSTVPVRVQKGSKLRFWQDIALEIATGEYTFEVALGAIGRADYEKRGLYSHSELHTKWIWLCDVPIAGQLTVLFSQTRTPVQLLHHGVANLPGTCRVFLEPGTPS